MQGSNSPSSPTCISGEASGLWVVEVMVIAVNYRRTGIPAALALTGASEVLITAIDSDSYYINFD